MELHRLIDSASYGPDTLRVLTQAFDEAWQEIEGNFANTCEIIEAARLLLASALLSVASEDSRDVQTLKNAALQVMARHYGTLRRLNTGVEVSA